MTVTNSKRNKKLYGALSFTFAGIMMATMATPAYALDYVGEGEILVHTGQASTAFGQADGYVDSDLQTLTTEEISNPEESLNVLVASEVELSEEYLAEVKRQEEAEAAREAARKAAEQAAQARQAQVSQPRSNHSSPALPSTSNIPVSERAAALVNAARGQIGIGQDCTDMVQNALAAIGMTSRRDAGGYDLGPMDFGRFGTQISPSEAKPGDILMRGGHVAIYTGDGVNHSAVHGGFNGGQTVESIYDANPGSYVVIRIG